MGVYASTHPGVKAMKGLHLFHFMMSNCSQRVRMALEEKELPWESHHMDLPANEHVSDEYQSINPNGVVPTLVLDGQVVIESNDILGYLDEHFPEPRLVPADTGKRAQMEERIASAGDAQPAMKALSHELLFRPFRKIDDAQLALYEEKASRDLVDFLRDYKEEGAAWKERVANAQSDIEARLDTLEAVLEQNSWLSGSDFGLADISWVVNAHRLSQANFDLSRWPALQAWYAKTSARPAFDRAIASYHP